MLQVSDGMGPAVSTAGLYVRFSKVPREDKEKTLAEGRPIFSEVDYITIVVPGDRSSEVCRPVTPDDRERFRSAWERHTSGQGDTVVGTPLRDWPGVTRAQVEELAYFNIRSVEQLAEVNDANLRNMGPVLALRQRARDYLERARSEAPLERLRHELEERDAKLARLQAQMEMLLGRNGESEESAPRARRRKTTEPEATPEVRPLAESEVSG